MDQVTILTYEPNSNGKEIVFTKDDTLLQVIQTKIDNRIKEHLNLLRQFKEQFNKDTSEEELISKAKEMEGEYTEEELYDLAIHEHIKTIVDEDLTNKVTLYREDINAFEFYIVKAIVGDTSAFRKKDQPNRDFYGPIVIAKYNHKGYIENLSKEDIERIRQVYDIY